MLDWYAYVWPAFEVEPVGHRYMRNLGARFKFETDSFVACASAIWGE